MKVPLSRLLHIHSNQFIHPILSSKSDQRKKKSKKARSKNHALILLLLSNLHPAFMETLQHLANESFSYGWLINLKPAALDGIDDAADEAASFIEVDPRWPSSRFSKRPSCELAQDFDFGLGPQPPLALLHADQLFSNGHLLPLHVLASSPSSPQLKASDKADSSAAADLDALLPGTPYDGATRKAPSSREKDGQKPVLERWRSCSKKVLRKSLSLIKPLCRCGGGSRRRSAAGKVGPETMSCPASEWTTPRTSSAYSSAGDMQHGGHVLLDSNVESSIYEAILHCKKSNVLELH